MGYNVFGNLEITGDDAALAYAALNLESYAVKHAARSLSPQRVTVEKVMAQMSETIRRGDIIKRLLSYGGYSVNEGFNSDGSFTYSAQFEGSRWLGSEDTLAFLAETGFSIYGSMLGEDGEGWKYATPPHSGRLIVDTLVRVPSLELTELQEQAQTLKKIRAAVTSMSDSDFAVYARTLLDTAAEK